MSFIHVMTEQNVQHHYSSSESHDPSETILICGTGERETSLYYQCCLFIVIRPKRCE